MISTEPGPRQLSGLWEFPLFAFSLLIACGTLALSLPGLIAFSRQEAPVEPAVAGPLVEAVPAPKPHADGNLLVEASRLAEAGRFQEALDAVGRYRAQIPAVEPSEVPGQEEIARREHQEQHLRADLAEAEVLEAQGGEGKNREEQAALEEAVRRYGAVAGALQGEEMQGEPGLQMRAPVQVRLGRARFKLLRAGPFREVAALEGILSSLRSVAGALTVAPWSDEAAYWQGELELVLGRPAEAERSYRRVGGTAGMLTSAALMRISGIYQDRQGLPEAHAAALASVQMAGGRLPGLPWIPAEEPERQLELLSQLWRQAAKPERALELEAILQSAALTPAGQVEHFLHAAQIHEQWAERLSAQPALARKEFRLAGLAYRGPLDAGIPAPWAQLLFRAAQAFERAGDVPETVRSLERFCASYGDDARFPQVVYLLAQHYRALGVYDKALSLLERSRPQLRRERGAVHYVPLALYEEGLCEYLSRSPGSRQRALASFHGILDHPDVYPDSQAWRDSLFALATMEYEDAQAGALPSREKARVHLVEWIERYPEDARQSQAHLMLGFMAWSASDFPAAATAFRVVADRARADSPEGSMLAMGRSAALLTAEAVYRDAAARSDKTALAEARDRFAEARDLNLGSWGAPWALARMADCSRALGQPAEAARLYAVAKWEYGQLGPSAGPAPDGTAGLEALVAWRADVTQWLGRP